MCLLNPENPALADSVKNLSDALDDLGQFPDSPMAFLWTATIADEQARITAAVRRNHERQHTALVLEKARMLSRPGRRGRVRTVSNVVYLTGKQVA